MERISPDRHLSATGGRTSHGRLVDLPVVVTTYHCRRLLVTGRSTARGHYLIVTGGVTANGRNSIVDGDRDRHVRGYQENKT